MSRISAPRRAARALATVAPILLLAATLAALAPSAASAATSLQNASLESASRSTPSCWTLGGYGSNSYTWTRTSAAHTGSYAESLSITSFSSGDRKLVSKQDAGTCAPTATSGHTYTVSGWYHASASPVIFAYYRNSSGSWVYWGQSPSLPSSSTWTNGTWTTPALPSGASAISFGLGLKGKGSLTVDDFALADTAAADPSPAPSPTPTPTPTPTSRTLFTEDFNAPLCSGNVWGTNPWITNACGRPEMQGDSMASIFYSVADSVTNVGSTESQTAEQRWWTHQLWADPNVRVSVKEEPLMWDSGAPAKSTWAAFTFFVRRARDSSYSSFYGVSPYVYNGQRHIEKKCVQSSIGSGSLAPFETGSMPDGEPYAYYLLANSPSGSQYLPAFGAWHDMAVTAENLADGSVALKVYIDGVMVQQATDTPGLTGCAPLTAGGTGWRSDDHGYRLDDFRLDAMP